MPKRTAIGTVTSDKMTKTLRVEIPRLTRHAKYGKFMRDRTICHVHDAKEEASVGDTVEIQECRPLSKTKHWELIRIVAKSRLVDLHALRAAQKAGEDAPTIDAAPETK